MTDDKEFISVLDHWGPTKRQRIAEAVKARQAAMQMEGIKVEDGNKKKATPPGSTSAIKVLAHKVFGSPTSGSAKPLTDKKANTPAPTDGKTKVKNKKLSKQPKSVAKISAKEIRAKISEKDLPPLELDARAKFLRKIHKDACGIFGTVLGPEANRAHENHFHLDLAKRKRNPFCQ